MATKGKTKPVSEDTEETAAVAPTVVAEGDAVYVNRDKLERAKDIVALVSGKRTPANDTEADRKERFAGHFATHEEDPKGKGAVRFVYEKLLAGLVRTPAEQEEAEADAAEARSKHKKKGIDS